MPERYELNETDMDLVEKAAKFTLLFEDQGISHEELFMRDAAGITALMHNIVVIYGPDEAFRILDVVRDALERIGGFEEMHEAYLLALDVKRGLPS